MTKFSSFSGMLLVFGVAAAAHASPHGKLSDADTDGDGAVSFAEMQVLRPGITTEQFGRLDANGDGVLERGEGRQSGRRHRITPPVDTNGDGAIDLTEMQAAHPSFPAERFGELDANGDGLLNADERPGRSGRGERFVALDADGSGGVSLEEMRTHRPEMDQEKFATIDADGNGEISQDEVRRGRGHRDRACAGGSHRKKGQGDGGNRGGQAR